MIKKLFTKLEKHNLSISSAESITGGRFSNLLTQEEGASKMHKGSFVCYSNDFKHKVLKVPVDIKIVSEEMAKMLAINSREITCSDISISFTGNASDNSGNNTPKGLTYIGISNVDVCEVIAYKSIEINRKKIIDDTAITGIQLLIKFIENNYK